MYSASWRRYAAVILLSLAGVLDVSAAVSMVFGPRVFTRGSGQPVTERVTFKAPMAGTYVLHLEAQDGASAIITLNGREIFRQNDFPLPLAPGASVATVDKEVTLKASNVLTVEVRSQKGSWIRLGIDGGPDAVPPVISATASPAANAAGWNNQNVTVAFTCSDAGSGIETCSSPVVVSEEGAGRVVTGEAVDRAGNRATASATLNIDKTAPAIGASVAPAANADGWHNGNVTVSFACTDALSGVAQCAAPVVLTGSGTGVAANGSVTDRAGNTATTSVAVNIDRTAPRITARLSTPANAAGWHTAPVTIEFDCTDEGAGIASCSAPVTISGEGAGQVAKGLARDRAGNVSEVTATVNVDLTAPRITHVLSVPANPAGWHQSDVTLTFACEDTLSGVAECPAPRTASAEGAQTIEVTVADRAGHTAVSTVEVKIDRTAPTITHTVEPLANAAGWHNAPVVVSFTCEDSGSGVAECPSPITVATAGAAQTVAGAVVDRAGNRADATANINLDLTPPSITATASASGTANGEVTVTFQCSDDLSGIAVCPAPVKVTEDGANQTVEGIATDVAGNSARATVSVSVDRTKPTITAIAAPAPNAAGWHNVPQVVVTFTCADTGSGVASCPDPVTVIAEGAAQQVTGTVRDNAGNTATATLEISLDRTAPTITAQPSASGWSNGDVTVRFVCSDSLSGVEHCTEPVSVTADGSHEITGAVVDKAGNAASTAVTVMVDRTAPTITGAADRAPNAVGWYNAPVTVTFECADAASGIATCTDPVVTSTNGAQSVNGTATDRAGNTASASLTLNIDTAAPTIRAITTPGTANGDVIVSFECEDTGGSGIAICPAQIIVTAEGTSEIEAEAVDRAGNSATVRTTVEVDRVAPTITASVAPAAGANGWHRGDVVVSFECSDAASGIESCTPAVTVTTDGAGQIISGTARDRAGNTASTSVTLNVDRTAPVVSVIYPLPGANLDRMPFTLSGSVSDALSGVAGVACGSTQALVKGSLFTCELSIPSGPSSINVVATDVAGNQRTVVVAVTYSSNSAPVADAGGPYNGETQKPISFDGSGSSDPEGQALTYAWTFGDGGTGSGRTPTHTYAEPGTYAVTLVVTDVEGTTATATSAATVVRANRQPVANAGGPYSADAGTTVTFSAAGSTDPDGDTLTYAWSFSDGGTASGVNPRRTFNNGGTYTATLTVTDGRGGTATASAEITIRAANQKPVANAGGPYEGLTGKAIVFDGSRSSDPDGDALTYAWSFGDGSTGTGASASHTFATAGSFTVSLTVSDSRGGSSSTTTVVSVQAANANPTANAGGPYSGRAGEPITFSGAASSDPDGDALTYSWNFGDGRSRTGVSPEHAYEAAGTYTVVLTTSDGRGGTATASVQVSVEAAPERENRPPVANAGGPYTGETGIPVTFNGTASTDPDGDALTYTWITSDGGKGSGGTFSYIFTQQTTHTVTLTVTDVHGASHQATANVSMVPRADRAPPVLSLSGPREVLPGTQAIVTAHVSDDGGVAGVRFEVTGGAASDVTSAPYQRTITVPEVASPGATIVVNAIARDAAGNTSTASHTLTIIVQPDSTAPVVALSAPARTAPGASIRMSATATDAGGIDVVTFKVNGAIVATDNSAPYEATFTVPADAPAGSLLQVTAEATDFAGNRGAASASVEVASDTDTTPPVVSINVPATAAPGETVSVTATASDANGIAAVSFTVDGQVVATVTAAPYQTQFVVASLPDGSIVKVEATALDFAGLSAAASADLRVATLTAGSGLVLGEVYDDATGLPVEGATVTARRVNGSTVSTAITDSRGRYLLSGPAGPTLVEITKDGWTPVERQAAISAGTATELLDARLTPLSPAAASATTTLGGQITGGNATLSVPAGAVQSPVSLRVTSVGPHALTSLTPLGWTPVAAAEISPRGVSFDVPAQLLVPAVAGIAAGTPLVFAEWNSETRAWIAVSTANAPQPGAMLSGALTRSGQYAWLKADAQPIAPAMPADGALVEGVASGVINAAATAQVTPQPRVLFYQPGIKSNVRSVLDAGGPLSSGTVLWSRISETYDFLSGSRISLEPFTQDFAFFQSPNDPARLVANYVVTPSMAFEAITLQKGIIGAEVVVPATGGTATGVVSSAGGRVETETGEALEVPSGLTTSVAVQLSRLQAAELGITLPSDVEFVGGVSVALAGVELPVGASLSVPRPAGLDAGSQLLLVRVQELQGRTQLVLVGLGAIDGDRVRAVLALPRNGNKFEGVRRGGRYLFLRASQPVGFVAGTVIGQSGAAFTGALVASSSSVVALSRGTAGYIAVARLGTVTLTATDLQNSDTGSATTAIAAAADEAAVDVRLIAQPPRVLAVQPAQGARNVPLASAVSVVFSKPLNPASVSGDNAGRLSLAGSNGAVAGTLSLSAGNTIATFRPVEPLAPDAAYTFTIAAEIADVAGRTLGTALNVSFTTLDTTAPEPPPAGSVTADIPDETGFSTIRGTQGTAAAHDTVVIENLTTGALTPVLLNSNGEFEVRVAARPTDKLQLRITDQAGNETVLALPRFSRTNPDGSVSASVDASGGRVMGPDGVAADVPAGAFPDGAIVTLKSVAEASFPVQLNAAQKQEFTYSGGVQIDFGGVEPKHYVDISVPAAAPDKVTDQWIVAQALVVNGVPTFNVADMALLEAGRITTASPPCPGVTAQGVYGIYKSKRDVGLNYGEIYHNDVNGGLRLDIEPIIPGMPGGFGMMFPVLVMKQRMPVCMPVLTGNISVVDNAIDIKIDPKNVTPADRSIVVENMTAVANEATGQRPRYSFPRNILELAFRVPGHEDDPFQVVITKIDGSTVDLTSTQIASIRQDSGAGTVTIRLNMDKLNVTPKKVTIRNLATNPVTETVFDQEVTSIDLSVAGGVSDELRVLAVDADGVERVLDFEKIGTTYPTGNIAVRAVGGTIDPTPAQIEEYNGWPVCGPTQPYPCRQGVLDPSHGVVRVMIGDESSAQVGSGPQGTPCGYATCMEVPLQSIERGAFVFPFNGDRSHRYGVHVFYADGKQDYLSIAGFRLVVTSTQTGRVIASLTAQAPPRGAPLNLGLITNDSVVPVVTGGPPRFEAYDPSQPLTFTFSKAINEATARRAILRDSAGRRIAIANVIVSPDGKQVTFVPESSLQLGSDYTLDLSEVTDLAGNRVLGQTIKLRTFQPRQLCPSDAACPAVDTGAFNATVVNGANIRTGNGGRLQLEPISDIDFFRARDDQGSLRTHLIMTLGGYDQTDFRFSSFDVTDPRAPFEAGREYGGRGKRRITLLPGLENFPVAPGASPGMPNSPNIFANPPESDPCYVPNQRFTGDIAIASSYTPDMSFVTFYNVTKPWEPCILGEKLLTASPYALNDFNRRGTIHASGFARGVVPLRHDGGISIFTAVQEVGVTRTNLAENIPSRYPADRKQDEVYAGDVIDIAGFRDNLLVARRDGPKFEVLNPNLSPLASIDLPERPVRVLTAEGYAFDANRDGQITQNEIRDLAFVATDTCSWGTGAGSTAGPACSGHIQVLDITRLNAPAIIGKYQLPGAVFSMDIDASRQRLLVGGSRWQHNGGGQAVYAIDISKPDESFGPDVDADGWDDRIVWRHLYPAANPNAIRIDRDRGLVYIGLAYQTSTSLERGAIDIWSLYDDCCDLGVDFTRQAASDSRTGDRANLIQREKEALRTGIKMALAEASTKWGALPGLAIMEQGSGACIWRTAAGGCDETYQPGISDHDFEVFFPTLAADAPGVLPLAVNCTIAQLNYTFTKGIPVAGGEPFKFDDVTFYPVSMAEYLRGFLGVQPAKAIKPELCGINEPAAGSDPGGDMGLGRQQLLMKWLLEGQYVDGVPGLTQPNRTEIYKLVRLGIPTLEGFEWSRLMTYNLAKSKAYIRVQGASEPQSAFHHLFQKQLHDAGKIGIRAALARMVSTTASNQRLLRDIGPDSYSYGGGCLDIREGVASSQWSRTTCTSFEQYVATAARETGVFDEATVQLIGRFYRVKSDKETIHTEGAADAFIRSVHQFVAATSAATEPIYQSTIQSDRYRDQRVGNLAALEAEVGKALTQAKLELTPRIFNDGFRNADEVLLAMYRGTGSSFNQVKALRVSLAGGEARVVRVPSDAGTPIAERNLNDISDVDPPVPGNKPHFFLGSGGTANPPINQTTGFGALQTVVFTLDLPTLSGDPGHKMKEPNRQNNYGGFHFYILDPNGAAAPAPAPVPFPTQDPSALEPDAACFTAPQLRVTSQNVDFIGNKLKVRILNTSGERITNVRVCSDLAGVCRSGVDIGPNETIEVLLDLDPSELAGTYGSNVTVYGRTQSGQDVRLTWGAQLTTTGEPFSVKAYDATPLSAIDHPLSRFTTTSSDTMGVQPPIVGATTDGTERGVRVEITGLRPNVPAVIRLLDTETKKVEDGNGHFDTIASGPEAPAHVGEMTVTPDLSGRVEVFYTTPAMFVRPGFNNEDFNRQERAVRINVAQDGVGAAYLDLPLRRPPVFLVHGLFGNIHVWKDFQPLVPYTPPVGTLEEVVDYFGGSQSNAVKGVPRPGFDGRFDVFVVGEDKASDSFAKGMEYLARDMRDSLQHFRNNWAIGKVDVIGHSMGGVLARRLSNEVPAIRNAMRKLILINSPQGGSPVADKIVEARDKLPIKREEPKPFDFLALDPSKITSVVQQFTGEIKVEWCSALLNTLGRTVYLNVHNGGVDDLRTPLTNAAGQPTEIGRLVNGGWNVPTHHIVDTTTVNDFGFSGEVTALWAGLGLVCNMTPDATTLEKTQLLRIAAEAVKTIAPIFKGATATRTFHKRPFGSAESKKIFVDLLKGTLKKGAEEVFVGEPPTIVFDSTNDRVVPVYSQLGNGVTARTAGPLGLGHTAVTEVFGATDHQAAKITPGINPNMCTVVASGTGRISFDEEIKDLNGDGKPDPTCKVMNLLEADPAGSKFYKSSGSQQ